MILCVVLSSFLAASPNVEESNDPARAAFTAGSAFYKQGQFKQALEEFEKTLRLKPHPTVTYNIGRCHEKLGDVPRALAAYRMYLKAAPDSKDAKAVTEAVARFENELKNKGIVQLFVSAEPSESQIEVDGKPLGKSPATVELGAGKHTLVISAPGYETLTRNLVTVLGRSSEMELSLKKIEKSEKTDVPVVAQVNPPDSGSKLVPDVNNTNTQSPIPVVAVEAIKPRNPKVFTWVAAGLALVAGGTGAVTGVMNKSSENRIASSTLRNDPVGTSSVETLQKEMSITGPIANVSFITAGVAGAAAIVLFFVEGN
jgi:tetratricopeptide (TPR) repeat protein